MYDIIKKVVKSEGGKEVVKARFVNEYHHEANFKRYGKGPILLKEWLLGLALPFPFYNHEIEKMGFNPETYWDELANHLYLYLYS